MSQRKKKVVTWWASCYYSDKYEEYNLQGCNAVRFEKNRNITSVSLVSKIEAVCCFKL